MTFYAELVRRVLYLVDADRFADASTLLTLVLSADSFDRQQPTPVQILSANVDLAFAVYPIRHGGLPYDREKYDRGVEKLRAWLASVDV